MINRNALRGAFVSIGCNAKEFSTLIEMNPETFNRKMKKGVFGSDEVEKMILILEINDYETVKNIFFDTLVT